MLNKTAGSSVTRFANGVRDELTLTLAPILTLAPTFAFATGTASTTVEATQPDVCPRLRSGHDLSYRRTQIPSD